MERPPDWFWNILDTTRPSLADLESWLTRASKEDVERFASTFESAATAICDYWAGPVVDGVPYSEDDTEDLCNWIVAQGLDLWERTIGGELEIATLARIVSRREFDRLPVAIQEWTTDVRDPRHRGYQAPETIASGVYFTRFGVVWNGEDE